MKNWTCCILSVVLIFTSSVWQISWVKEAWSFFLSFFMGMEDCAVQKEIIIDLSQNNVSDEMKIEIENIKKQISLEKTEKQPQKPTVLIYHTHTDEAYFKGENDYVETSVGRTKNQQYSVVAVGDKLKTELENYGFTVIHDKTDNVSAGFNKAYQTSYETIKSYIGKVDVFIDLHRDAYYGQNPNYISNENNNAARLCFVVANGENYTYKPNWQENYKLAQKLTDSLNEICPKICKDVIFKNTRFNQHVADKCLLIEVGNEQNDINEAKESAKIIAEAFNTLF